MRALILTMLLLSGCASMVEEEEPVIPESKKVVEIDKRALEPCKPLNSLGLHNTTFESLLEVHKENVIVYRECKEKQDTSIKLLKEFANQ